MSLLVQYVSALVVFVVIDGIWLGVLMRGFYQRQIGPLMRDGILLTPAIAFYLLYAAGLVVFAVAPAVRSGQWTTAAVLGGFLGLVAYATYDLSNLATLRGFPAAFALADLAWGTVLSAATATLAFLIARALSP